MAQRADQAGSRESAPSIASEPSATVSRRSIRPPSWQAGLRQIGLGLAIFAVYLAVTHLVPKDRVVADAHGRDLLRLEERFGIAWEHGLNDFLAGHPLLGLLASWEYATTYVVVTFGVLLWVWRRRPDVYPWARNTLAGSTLAAIVCFAVWPTSPPRLLPGESFTDVVALNHPPGSWGTDVVSAGADQFAAMPSLHVGWAAWVLAVIARLHVSRLALALGSLHFAITTVDVLATGTHYVADAMAGALLILAAVGAEAVRAAWLGPSAPPRRPLHRAPAVARWYPVAAEDAFFLHIESAVAPQLVGGLAILAGRPDVDAMRAAVAAKLPVLPRLRQVVRSGGLRRRPRWLDVDHVDLSWHIPEIHLPAGGGWEALRRIVSEILAAPLDRSRPLWRLLLVPDVAPGRSALIVLFHHAVGDGLGVLSIVRELLEPVAPFAADDAASGPGRVETPARRRYRLPGPFSRAALTAVGLAQLATDGVGTKLPGFEALSGRRELVGFSLPLDAVRKAARENGCRVTDLVVAAVGDAVACALAAVGIPGQGRRTRAAVPITLRPPAEPGVWDGMPGNRTAALMVDVPLDPIPVGERLRAISADAERRRRSGRPLASAAVVRSIGLLPARWHEWLARLIYRPPHFGLIVTNIPGPDIPLAFVGVPVVAVYPLVSLAEDVPLAVGALGWNGRLCVAATLDSAWAVDTALLLNRLREAFSALGVDTDADGGTLW